MEPAVIQDFADWIIGIGANLIAGIYNLLFPGMG
ncbi:MAG: hypothetical protein MASP_00362 [Candidatus Methanolliviera sp. GoM_asphalt]|nr:MAG: hypothetical protein MASP_00362 [Candidatus Methanolliviera sp. GoM_asphalt]